MENHSRRGVLTEKGQWALQMNLTSSEARKGERKKRGKDVVKRSSKGFLVLKRVLWNKKNETATTARFVAQAIEEAMGNSAYN